MKKFTIIFAIISLSAFALSGCFLKNRFDEKPPVSFLQGILEEQKPNDDFSGSHVITDRREEKTALRSLSINLSKEEYLGNMVQVSGFLNEEDNVFEVSGISVLDYINDYDPDAEFTDYKNSEFGIELKYYDNWRVDELNNSVEFSPPTKEEDKIVDKVVIEQSEFPYSPTTDVEGNTDTPLQAYFTKNFPEVADVTGLIRKIGPGQLEAVKMTEEKIESGGNVDYFLYRNGLVYRITFVNTKGEDSVKNLSIFNQMISEFKFIGFSEEQVGDDDESEPLPVLDIKMSSFQSLPYGFEADYPASWYYAGERGTGEVSHHYGFSDKPLEDSDELISLDVLNQKTADSFEVEGIKGYFFRVTGNADLKDLIKVMSASIRILPKE